MPNDRKAYLTEELLEVHRTLGWMDLVIGSISDAVCVTDSSGHLVFANDRFAQMVGKQRVFLLGKLLDKLFSYEEVRQPLAEFAVMTNKLAEDGAGYNGICRWKNSSGETQTLRITSRLLPATQQTVYLIQNITREYELTRMKNKFIDLASHQLRTPMTSIMTYAHMLNDGFAGDLTPDQAKLTDTIMTSSERMIQLVNSLLSITRAQNDLRPLTYSSIQLTELFGKIDSELGPRLEQNGLKLEYDALDDQIYAQSDESVLREIFSNLIVNAIQYTDRGGTIRISSVQSPDYLSIYVRDTGIGIPADYIPHLFEQFSRADNALEKHPEGTGLGLFLIKILLEKLGGSISCESKLGEGTTFIVSLPVRTSTKTATNK